MAAGGPRLSLLKTLSYSIRLEYETAEINKHKLYLISLEMEDPIKIKRDVI
jgi:hypothetical protein